MIWLKNILLWLLPKRRKHIPNPEARTGGVEVSKEDKRDLVPSISSTNPFPNLFTLRPSLTRVETQGSYNSCVGCSITTCLETMAKNNGWSNVLELSKMHLWNQARKLTWRGDSRYENRGVFIRDGWKVAQKGAVTIEKLFPYTPAYFNKEIDSSFQWKWYPKFKYYFIRKNHDESIKEVLTANTPLVVGLKVNRDFIYWSSKEVYKPLDHVFALSHAVLIVGWNDSKNAYLIQNSWGRFWGHNGFAWVDKEWLIKSSFDLSYPEVQ